MGNLLNTCDIYLSFREHTYLRQSFLIMLYALIFASCLLGATASKRPSAAEILTEVTHREQHVFEHLAEKCRKDRIQEPIPGLQEEDPGQPTVVSRDWSPIFLAHGSEDPLQEIGDELSNYESEDSDSDPFYDLSDDYDESYDPNASDDDELF